MDQLDESSRRKQKAFQMLNNTIPFLVFLQQKSEHRYKLIEQLAMALYEKGYKMKRNTPLMPSCGKKCRRQTSGQASRFHSKMQNLLNNQSLPLPRYKSRLIGGLKKCRLSSCWP
ncbi:hypothetical protein P7F88_11005 [Vibrio hannami]|nr:hypothetical protein [Vibrio hannami]MDG3086611.1 hypothetical protein [Vibrio hannami]